MFKSFSRKRVMTVINKLIEKNYGTYNELIDRTIQELMDIIKVIESSKQEQQINQAIG